MPAAGQKFLGEMLDRLYAALSNGPSLNCRPHASRQRLDFQLLAQLGDETPGALLARLLSAEKSVKLTVKQLPKPPDPTAEDQTLTAEQQASRRAWKQQEAALTKLRAIAEDSRTFEQDTGSHVLFVGFPLLHLPPGRTGKGGTKRVLAPVAFIPVHVALSRGRTTTLQLGCVGEGSERVTPNTALLAWLARETGQRAAELPDDEAGNDPFKEINAIVGYVRQALGLSPGEPLGPETSLHAAPRSDDEDADQPKIHTSAVLGLFPHSNQALIADTEALVGGEPLIGPGEAFVSVQASGGRPTEASGGRGAPVLNPQKMGLATAGGRPARAPPQRGAAGPASHN
ncbi:MAG: DUF4011 domain-containing protein, partial [Planctomycetia bacterium]|nr:DUF4011 domain-containing protein [Planctomycetia bacterium]